MRTWHWYLFLAWIFEYLCMLGKFWYNIVLYHLKIYLYVLILLSFIFVLAIFIIIQTPSKYLIILQDKLRNSFNYTIYKNSYLFVKHFVGWHLTSLYNYFFWFIFHEISWILFLIYIFWISFNVWQILKCYYAIFFFPFYIFYFGIIG